jgi:hypothetical protein
MEIPFYIGQKITTYYAGYFEVTRIERRWLNKTKDTEYAQRAYNIRGEYTDECGEEFSPIIYFKQLYDAKGNPKKSKEKGCDMSYCKPAIDSVNAEIQSLQELVNKLSNLKLD